MCECQQEQLFKEKELTAIPGCSVLPYIFFYDQEVYCRCFNSWKKINPLIRKWFTMSLLHVVFCVVTSEILTIDIGYRLATACPSTAHRHTVLPAPCSLPQDSGQLALVVRLSGTSLKSASISSILSWLTVAAVERNSQIESSTNSRRDLRQPLSIHGCSVCLLLSLLNVTRYVKPYYHYVTAHVVLCHWPVLQQLAVQL